MRLAGGASLGRTGSDGLLDAPTPADLIPPESDPSAVLMGQAAPASPILIVEARNGHALLVPFDVDGQGGGYRGEWGKDVPSVRSAWWSVIGTDRSIYRRDDQIAAWGFLREPDRRSRARFGRTAPGPARERRSGGCPGGRPGDHPPGPSGAYAAELPLAGVAVGSYYLEAVVDGHVASASWIDVGIIHKPAYRLTVTTDRHVVIGGDRVNVTVGAAFFDGQPVPGTPLAIRSDEDEDTILDTVSTNADGTATTALDGAGPVPGGSRVHRCCPPSRPGPRRARSGAMRPSSSSRVP